jgi:hypothetical protein
VASEEEALRRSRQGEEGGKWQEAEREASRDGKEGRRTEQRNRH